MVIAYEIFLQSSILQRKTELKQYSHLTNREHYMPYLYYIVKRKGNDEFNKRMRKASLGFRINHNVEFFRPYIDDFVVYSYCSNDTLSTYIKDGEAKQKIW